MSKIIEFIPLNDFSDPPVPSFKFMPSWYKNVSKYIDKENKTSFVTRENLTKNLKNITNLTVKNCIPVFDSITGGYTVFLQSDIMFLDSKIYPNRVAWRTDYYVPISAHAHEQMNKNIFFNKECDIFKWNFDFVIKTPPGYSCVFSHPKHHYDLPFFTLDGIVDTDKHPVAISFPFLIDLNFIGKIEKGTPICQIFPFKRESWKSKVGKKQEKKYQKNVLDKFNSILEKSYKKQYWTKKEYK
jgi:hypothetical protein